MIAGAISYARLGREEDPAFTIKTAVVFTSYPGATAAQVALAWVMAQGDHIVPIPGAKRIPHLEQNAAAVDLVLEAAELELLSRTFAAQAVSGSRYSPTFEAMTQK